MWWKCILLTVFWLALARPGECAPIGLDEAIEQQKQWQAKIQTIRVMSVTTMIGRSTPSDDVDQTEWIWDRSGRSVAAEHQLIDGRLQRRTHEIVIGFKSFDVRYHAGEPWSEPPTELSISSDPTGRASWGSHYWLKAIQSHNQWLCDRLEDLRKTETPKVLVTPEGFLQIETSTETIVLDPNHNYLPKELKRTTDFATCTTVKEYREIEPGFWFPWKGEYHDVYVGQNWYKGDDIHRQWEIKQVDLNPSLPEALFEIPKGDGTREDNWETQEHFVYIQEGQELIKRKAPRVLLKPDRSVIKMPDPAVFMPLQVFLNGLKSWPGLFAVLVFGGLTILIRVQRRRARLAAPVTQDVDDVLEP